MNRTRCVLMVSFCLSLLAFVAAPLAQADEMYLWAKGQKQGQIKGGVVKKGLENSIEVARMNYEVASPRDAASGAPTGKRQHKPFTITKSLDKSSPLLLRALVENENLPEVFLDTFVPQMKTAAGAGMMVKLQTIKLINATVVGYRRFTEPDARGGVHTLEDVTFVFQAIEILHHDGGIMAGDSWMAK